jgi:hypothetical protein
MFRLARTRNKSFFASFFSKKEEPSFSEEKEAKRLLSLRRLQRIVSVANQGAAQPGFQLA